MIEGDAVVHEVELAAPPDDVFRMFVDPARLIRWLGIAAELEPRPGGRFRFEIQPGQFCEGEYVIDRGAGAGWRRRVLPQPPAPSPAMRHVQAAPVIWL